MAGIKDEAIQLIRSLPESATLDDIMAQLYFKLQVDTGLGELDEGKRPGRPSPQAELPHFETVDWRH